MVYIHFRIATFHLSRICYAVLTALVQYALNWSQRKCKFPVRHDVAVPYAFKIFAFLKILQVF